MCVTLIIEQGDIGRNVGDQSESAGIKSTWLWAVWPPAIKPAEIDARIQEWLKKSKGIVDVKNSKDTVELRADGTVLSRSYYGHNNKPGE